MTYTELAKRVGGIKVGRASHVNRKRLLDRGLAPLGTYKMRGKNGRYYTTCVMYGRNRIWLASKHHSSTLERWCSESVVHLTDMAIEGEE